MSVAQAVHEQLHGEKMQNLVLQREGVESVAMIVASY